MKITLLSQLNEMYFGTNLTHLMQAQPIRSKQSITRNMVSLLPYGDAVFGGADIDLRQAEIMDKAILKASSIFGGIFIYVPDDVKVEVASTSICGGVSDKRKDVGRKKKSKDDEGSKEKQTKNAGRTLYIDANCVFGGVEIR